MSEMTVTPYVPVTSAMSTHEIELPWAARNCITCIVSATEMAKSHNGVLITAGISKTSNEPQDSTSPNYLASRDMIS